MARLSTGLAILFAALLGSLAWASVAWLPQTGYYAYLMMSPVSGVAIEYFMGGNPEAADCDSRLGAMRDALHRTCDACVVTSECIPGLTPRHREALGYGALDRVSLRISDGVLVFDTVQIADAMTICRATAAQLQTTLGGAPSCVPPGEFRRLP
jgi:hypothetical protein